MWTTGGRSLITRYAVAAAAQPAFADPKKRESSRPYRRRAIPENARSIRKNTRRRKA